MKESRAKLADKYIRQLKEKQRNRLCKKGGAHIVSTAFLFGVLFCSVPFHILLIQWDDLADIGQAFLDQFSFKSKPLHCFTAFTAADVVRFSIFAIRTAKIKYAINSTST